VNAKFWVFALFWASRAPNSGFFALFLAGNGPPGHQILGFSRSFWPEKLRHFAHRYGAANRRSISLVHGQFWLAAEPDAAGLRPFPSFAGACTDQIALEFGQAAEHSQHQPAERRRRVGPRVAERSKPAFLSVIAASVFNRSRVERAKAVEPRDQQHTSPSSSCAIALRSCGRSAAARAPDATSRNTFLAPVVRSRRTCVSTL
jgi:hypothetical protein